MPLVRSYGSSGAKQGTTTPSGASFDLPKEPKQFVAFYESGGQGIVGYVDLVRGFGIAGRGNESSLGSASVSGTRVTVNLPAVGGTVYYTYV